MILDKGIARIFRKVNAATDGHMPEYVCVPLHEGWYGELSFETAPARPTDNREEVRTDARVRVLQNRQINNHDVVELHPTGGTMTLYEVTRAFHGTDEDSGELITDLNLEVIEP